MAVGQDWIDLMGAVKSLSVRKARKKDERARYRERNHVLFAACRSSIPRSGRKCRKSCRHSPFETSFRVATVLAGNFLYLYYRTRRASHAIESRNEFGAKGVRARAHSCARRGASVERLLVLTVVGAVVLLVVVGRPAWARGTTLSAVGCCWFGASAGPTSEQRTAERKNARPHEVSSRCSSSRRRV
ncbi:uncharacterized protein LOC116849082 [Odontomachus brunneus]|uniref:uncharacterized protein LOC116849082 n=1 Tax=Odontomachus brunneus TaxID=486640 RepID=UPI0013F1F8CB|nr:uncharacterized protein LOC116849082 [Odontomachus brunneus]